ncbi:hypothetical protein V6N11_043249 [Hibiscus sabdariffa]|uniref:RNase H type-1 domain-containing protein n=1 Tax=Hibiscus sabdariffa TaxID=183260 RepID=A0ABR2QZB4_9ROSI
MQKRLCFQQLLTDSPLSRTKKPYMGTLLQRMPIPYTPLTGFYRSIGIASTFNTELWAIYTGLQLAWDNGFQKVQIQSDCLEAVTTVQDDAAGSNSNSLVRAIAKLRRGHWYTEVKWIP